MLAFNCKARLSGSQIITYYDDFGRCADFRVGAQQKYDRADRHLVIASTVGTAREWVYKSLI